MRDVKTMLLAALATALSGTAHADVTIGTAGPTTNAEALFGVTWMNGMELAVRQANAAGGVQGQKLILLRDDDGGDPKQGTLVAQKHCDNAGILAVTRGEKWNFPRARIDAHLG